MGGILMESFEDKFSFMDERDTSDRKKYELYCIYVLEGFEKL